MSAESGEQQYVFTTPNQSPLDWNGVRDILQAGDTGEQLEMGEPGSGVVRIFFDPYDVARLFTAVNSQLGRVIETAVDNDQTAAETARENFFLMSAAFWLAQAVSEGGPVSVAPLREGEPFIRRGIVK